MANSFRACGVDSCNSNAHWSAKGGRGWCSSHYDRWRRNGDPTAGRITPGTCGDWLKEHSSYTGDGCLKWPFARDKRTGYGVVTHNGAQTTASRAMCEIAHGAPEGDKEAAHSCGNGHQACCNPRHLRWADHLENEADKLAHGTLRKGSRSGRAKLTEEDVRSIRALNGVMSHRLIAARFCVDRAHISLILRGGSWRHLA